MRRPGQVAGDQPQFRIDNLLAQRCIQVLDHPAMLEWERAALAETSCGVSHEEELAAAGVITANYRNR